MVTSFLEKKQTVDLEQIRIEVQPLEEDAEEQEPPSFGEESPSPEGQQEGGSGEAGSGEGAAAPKSD